MDTTTLGLQSSTNYEMFSFLGTNRYLSEGHVEKLKRAFEEVGNLTEVQPILVNENFEIIDGQHRFQAAKELHQPVYYMQRPGLTVKEARSMNILHRGWTALDFARSYADGGDPNYQKYMELRETYGFAHNITLVYIYGGEAKGLGASFRDGEMVIPDLPAAIKRLEMLAEVRDYTPIATSQQFAIALLYCSRVTGFSIDELTKKLVQVAHTLHRVATVADGQRMIEDAYNYNTRSENRLQLYYL